MGCTKKNNFSHRPWCSPLVNTSLISQFRENVSTLNFLAKALHSYEVPGDPQVKNAVMTVINIG